MYIRNTFVCLNEIQKNNFEMKNICHFSSKKFWDNDAKIPFCFIQGAAASRDHRFLGEASKSTAQ